MSKSQSSAIQSTPLPGDVSQLQKKLEDLYLKRLALERDVLMLRATQPVILNRPKRSNVFVRFLRRMTPRLQRKHHLSLIQGCGLFDADWYTRTYPDVATDSIEPAQHYLHHGVTDLRNPGPYFDTAHYLHLYPDIADNGMNPLVHYILSGVDEGRSIRPGMPHGVLS